MNLRRFFSLAALISRCSSQAMPQRVHLHAQPGESESRQEFQDAKFGMFIHWGVNSVLVDGEWVLMTAN